jgi:beta-glucosidase
MLGGGDLGSIVADEGNRSHGAGSACAVHRWQQRHCRGGTAASSQVAVVFVSQWESEGMDLPSLNLTDLTDATPIDQDALVSAVAAANPHTIVVIESGGPVVMPWLSQVGAVLEAWYPGQSGGPAIADLLFGKTNPSASCPSRFPPAWRSCRGRRFPRHPDSTTPFEVNYFEGFNVGYKWYDSQGLTPLFPFGFGLSYTTFSSPLRDRE